MRRIFEMILNWLKSLFFGEPQETPVEPEPTDEPDDEPINEPDDEPDPAENVDTGSTVIVHYT